MAAATTELHSEIARSNAVSMGFRRVISAIGWMSFAQFVGLAIRLGSSLVLSRLLSPEAYGILSPALAVLLTLEWFCDLGVRPSLIRHPDGGTFVFLNAGWWIDVARSVGMGFVVLALAWPLAEFLKLPELAAVLATFALYPILQALRSPGLVNLRRDLNYRAIVANELVQTIAGTVVTLAVAWFHPSVWAMVAGMFAGAAAGVLHSYMLCLVLPSFLWDKLVARQVLHGSRSIFVNTLLMAIWLNAERIFGLRLISVEEMGLYAIALNLAGVVDFILGRACDVYYSYLSRTADAAARADRHERCCLQLAVGVMPALGLAALLAPSTIRLLFDSRYAGSGILLAVMIVRLMLRALGQVQFQYFLARADLRASTVAYAVALVTQLALLVPFSSRWNALGLAAAGVVSTALFVVTQSLLIWRSGHGQLKPMFLTFGWMTLTSVLLFLL